MKHISRMAALTALVALLAAPAHGADPWSARDVALQATYTALHVMDWGQTRYIATHPERHFERNPLLGRHPHKDKVDLYFAGTLVAHTVVTHLLPKEWRPWWQGVTIALEGSCVGWNIAGGVKVRF